MFTLCMLSWKRSKNIGRIINSFRSQIFGDKIKFLVWNNNPEIKIEDYISNKNNVEIFNAEKNYGTRAKLFLFAKTKTKYIIGWDDDVIPKNNSLFNMYKNLMELEKKSPAVVAYHGWRFARNWKTYEDVGILNPALLEEIDHFGPGCCMFRKELVNQELLKGHGSDIIDDTWASFVFKTSFPEIKFWRLANPTKFIEWTEDSKKHGIYTTKHKEVVGLKTEFMIKTRNEWKKINER